MLKTHHDKALCILAASGILPSVKYLVEKRRYDINCFDGTCSAFYMAVKHCHWDVAFYLLRAGADPLIVEAERDLPKLLPKTHRSKFNKALASALLRLSAEAKVVPGLGWPQLMGAADEKMNALFARRFELHASLVGKDDYGLRKTWLELASNTATGGNESLLRKLLAGEILPDYTRWGLNELLDDPDEGPFGMDGCPILGASMNGHIGCVDALLEFVYKRSPPKIRYEAPWQAFKQAAKYRQYPLVNYLLKRHHCKKRNRKCLKMLQDDAQNEEYAHLFPWLGILAEVDIDVADCAPTHTEALGGNKKIKIPVVYLMSECTVENLKLLCKHMGFVIRPRNPILKEVLSRAAEIGNEPLKEYFLNKGFDARLVLATDSMTISFTYQKGKIIPPK
ncbi:hypothetical protein N7475_010422 [Penicillium sp. IBT 31633x]|nr:hypothetical protein N7475_010422 [Penicillium sp. IBT 31633x]